MNKSRALNGGRQFKMVSFGDQETLEEGPTSAGICIPITIIATGLRISARLREIVSSGFRVYTQTNTERRWELRVGVDIIYEFGFEFSSIYERRQANIPTEIKMPSRNSSPCIPSSRNSIFRFYRSRYFLVTKDFLYYRFTYKGVNFLREILHILKQ